MSTTFCKYKSFEIQQGKRILKVEQFGIKTASESLPFGIDSCAIENMTAIYVNTSNDAESVIVGYINKNQVAQAGETRLFSVDGSGSVVGYVFLKNDGTLELNGNTYTSTRFEPLKTCLNAQDNLINIELGKIATAISGLGGVYVPGTVTTNIDNAKSEDVKLK